LELGLLGIILAAISGLYALLWKNHGCIKRTESKLDTHLAVIELEKQIIDLKDNIRMLKK